MSKKGGIKMKIADITYQSRMGEFINIEQASSQADILETLINNIKDSLTGICKSSFFIAEQFTFEQ